MPQVTLNYLAIVVCAILTMPLGFLWYGPLFGKTFMKLTGMSGQMTPEGKKQANVGYAVSLLTAFVMAYILSHFVDYAGATTWMDGMQAGFWSWLGFVVTTNAGGVLWEKRPLGLYVMNMAYYLVTLLVMGAILAAWV